jgi:hypothetical protein
MFSQRPSVLPLYCCTLPEALLVASPDFQTKLGYPLPPANGANLSTASKANAQKYNTLSLVLEQPFKDTIGEGCSTCMQPVPAVHAAASVLFCASGSLGMCKG